MWYSLCLVFGLVVWLGLRFDMLLSLGFVGCLDCLFGLDAWWVCGVYLVWVLLGLSLFVIL